MSFLNSVFLKFLLILLTFFSVNQLQCVSQVIIPIREGFPYCEPFTGTGADVRANTVFGGQRFVGGIPIDIEPTLTGESLQLTTNGNNENGYVFVDIPFPSFYGLKVSFEYSSYGRSSDIGADGFSFFMFDGTIDESSFEIGQPGGALGYTARQSRPGLKGAYIGIGFDEFGNFGNYYENKRYSFLSTTAPPVTVFGIAGDPSSNPENFYSHSVVVRGPVAPGDNVRNDALNYSSYEFISGKLLNNDFGDFPGVAEEFYLPDSFDRLRVDIDSPSRVFDCDEEGYRKVFIDLQPKASGGYTISVWILAYVNGQRQVFPVIDSDYDFPPPPFLKVGFAASTGGRNNFHEIKNVTVEVSDESQLNPPIIQAQNREVCEGEQLDFEFPVELLNDGSFVRCVQLFETEQQALDSRPEETPPGQIPGAGDCGLSGNCQLELCQVERTVLSTEFGTFETFLIEESNGEFSQGIDFESNTSTSGEVTVYYTVVDNFGQVSLPKPITIVVNPLPQPEITTIDPLIWEESEVNDIYVRLEANPSGAGFQYQWYKDGSPIAGATNDFFLAEGAAALGNYTVEIIDDNGCFGASAQAIAISLVEDLEPDISNGVLRETCAAEGSITVSFDASSILGDEKWKIVDEDGSQVYPAGDGWNSIAAGTPSVTQANLLAGNYTFQIGDSFREGQLGSDGIPLFRHQIPFTIDPIEFPLIISVSSQDELCYEEGGTILVEASDGNGTYTYELFQEGNLILSSGAEIAETSYEFQGIPVGSYEIRVGSGSRCEEFDVAVIDGPTPVLMEVSDFKNVTCGDNDGYIEWTASGGTGDYAFVSISRDGVDLQTDEFNLTQNGGVFLAEGLSVGEYLLTISDENGCTLTSPSGQEITLIPKPEINIITNSDYCEGEEVVLVPELIVSGNMVDPEYTWISHTGDLITETTTIGGIVYTLIDHDDDAFTPPHLSVLGLVTGEYEFSLELRGIDSCNPEVSTDFTVNPLPMPTIVRSAAAICFGSSDGIIEVGIESGEISEFEFMLEGITQFQDNPIFTTGIGAGTYTIIVRNKDSGCEESILATVSEPDELLATLIDKVDPTCGENNGLFNFQIEGGTPFTNDEDYSISINGEDFFEMGNGEEISGNIFTLTQLSDGPYEILINDGNNCSISLAVNLTAQEIPQFGVDDIIVCEGDMAVLTAETIVLAGATPVFNWFRGDPSGTGELIQVNDGEVVNGTTFQIEDDQLLISGLTPNDDPYLFYLKLSGDLVCPAPELPAAVVVNPLPIAEFEVVDILCFGSNSGEIRLVSEAEPGFTFTLLETGETTVDGNFLGLPAGEFTIRIDSSEGCFSIFNQTIAQPEDLSIQMLDQEDPTCGDSNGLVSFSVAGGVPEYEIIINDVPISEYTYQVEGNNYTLQGLAPGNYSVAVSDANACEVNDLFTLVNNDGFLIEAEEIELTICEGGVASLDADVTIPVGAVPVYRWYRDSALTQQIVSGSEVDGVSYEIDQNGILGINGLVQGDYIYYLRISGANICGLVTTAQIEVLEPISAEVESTLITCFGEETGTITILNTSGGSGSFEYSLDKSIWQSSAEFTGLAGGNYTVWVRDINQEEGCELIFPNILVDSPEATISTNTPDIYRGSCGLDNGRIFNLNITGGWGDYLFEWRMDDPEDGELMTQGTITELDGLQPGVYFLKIVDAEGCEAIFEYEVGVLSDPEYQLVPMMDICEGQPVEFKPVHLAPDTNLPPAAATEVFWYKNSGQVGLIESGVDPADPTIFYTIDDSSWINPKLTIEGLTPGEYTYYFFVECTGVEHEISVTIHEASLPVFETERVSCAEANDGRIMLASGGTTDLRFSVDNGPWETAEQLESRGFSAGSYTIVTMSDLDCQPDPQVLEILGPAPLNLLLLDNKNSACGVADGYISIQINGGWPSYKLKLTNTSTNTVQEVETDSEEFIFDNLPSGIYEVELEDAEGCIIGLSEPVQIEDGPTEILIDNLVEICVGELIRLVPEINPPAASKTFKWYRGTVTPANEIINGEMVDGASYQINSAGALEIAGLSVADSPYLYSVIVTGSDICEGDEQEIQVIVFPDPVFTATVEHENCFGEGGTIVLNSEGGASNITFSVNNGPFQTYPSNRIENLAQGSYIVTARHGSGCEYTLQDRLEIEGPNEQLEFSAIRSADASCGEANGLISGAVIGGSPPYTITMRNNAGIVVTPEIEWSDETFDITGVGLGVFTLEVEDSNGCTLISSEQLIEDAPTPLLIDDLRLCEGEDAVLIPSIPNTSLRPTYTWYRDPAGEDIIPNGQSTLGDISFNLENSGRMIITGLSASPDPYVFYIGVEGNGVCSGGIEEVQVLVSPLPQLRTSNPSIICDPLQTVDLTQYIEGFNSDVYEYVVTGPSGIRLRLEELHTISKSGNYLVSMRFKGSDCFTPTERILVLIADSELVADFDYQLDLGGGNLLINQDVGILEDVDFIDNSQGNAVIWNWDFGDGNSSTDQKPVHQYTEKGAFTITLYTLDEMGCSSQFQRVIQVFDDYLIEIPDAFTPSRADGKNNFFIPKFRGISTMELLIFNTWGELIYETNSLEDKGWDGTLNGKPTPNGNYVYKAIFKTRAGETVERAGVFILIR